MNGVFYFLKRNYNEKLHHHQLSNSMRRQSIDVTIKAQRLWSNMNGNLFCLQSKGGVTNIGKSWIISWKTDPSSRNKLTANVHLSSSHWKVSKALWEIQAAKIFPNSYYTEMGRHACTVLFRMHGKRAKKTSFLSFTMNVIVFPKACVPLKWFGKY